MLHKILHTESVTGHNLNVLTIFLCSKFCRNKFFKNQLCQKSDLSINLSPSHVLSETNKEKCLNLLNAVKPVDINLNKNIKKAAVLVPLCEVDNQVALLYIVRSFHLKSNGGEVAFPGGMLDKSDGSLKETALRETHEEIGISPSEIDVWGKGPEVNRRDVQVTPFLGYIGPVDPKNLKINSNEVSVAFCLSLDHLASPKNFRTTKFRFGKSFIYKTPVYLGGTKRIWGLTAYVTHLILSSLISEYYKNNIKFQASAEKVLYKKIKK